MNDLSKVKDLTQETIAQQKNILHIKIKAIRALSFVFDITIITIAVLYIFDVDFSSWLMIPALSSVVIHSYLSYQNNKISLLSQQEVILKYLKK